jgi:antitoxin component of MazEF toxin-antitoxin module
MPLIRKIVQIGTAKAVVLPKSWLEWVKNETGSEPKEVLLEVDNTLTIIPLIGGKQVKSEDGS